MVFKYRLYFIIDTFDSIVCTITKIYTSFESIYPLFSDVVPVLVIVRYYCVRTFVAELVVMEFILLVWLGGNNILGVFLVLWFFHQQKCLAFRDTSLRKFLGTCTAEDLPWAWLCLTDFFSDMSLSVTITLTSYHFLFSAGKIAIYHFWGYAQTSVIYYTITKSHIFKHINNFTF